MDPLIEHLAEEAGFNFDEYNEVLKRKIELLIELIGWDMLELTNKHGNIKPREVKKYFGIKDE